MELTNRQLFINAFLEADDYFLGQIPAESEIDYKFSEKFEKKIEKLIRAERKVYWRFVNTTYKKAIIAAVIMAIILSCVLGVSAVREGIIKFIIEKSNTSYDFKIDGNGTNDVLYKYRFSSIPEGFRSIKVFEDPTGIDYVYVNDIGDVIELSQHVTDGAFLTYDNEHGTLSEITVNGMKVYIYVFDPNSYSVKPREYTAAEWLTEDGYSLCIKYDGHIELDEMIALIESVE